MTYECLSWIIIRQLRDAGIRPATHDFKDYTKAKKLAEKIVNPTTKAWRMALQIIGDYLEV